MFQLCRRLDVVLDSEDGSGDVGKPDKVPVLTQGQRGAATASTNNKKQNGKKSKSDVDPQQHLHVTALPSKRTLQVINIWKADTAFRFENHAQVRCKLEIENLILTSIFQKPCPFTLSWASCG